MNNYQMQAGDIILDHYEVQELLCSGGEGMVAKGIDRNNGDEVAIKHYTSINGPKAKQNKAIQRLKRTANAKINHPNVVDCIDYGEDDGQWFTIMPFIEGEDLDVFISRSGGRLDVNTAVKIVSILADALNAIHSKGFVHRDIKLQNIRIDQHGNPHIMDMGICKDINSNTITDGNNILGTIEFMSPEQLMNASTVAAPSDTYSLGAVFYYMLTGKLTFPTTSNCHDVFNAIANTTPPIPSSINPDIPAHIDTVCMKMLAKNPQNRFQTAQDITYALNGGASMQFPTQAPPLQNSCSYCGAPQNGTSSFCHNCGAGLIAHSNSTALCLACGTQTGESPVCCGCGKPFSQANHRFTFMSGPLAGMVFRLPEGEYYIGRKEICERDYSISRRHLSVQCLNGTVIIADAGSSNGTYIAGFPAQRPTTLIDHCEVKLSRNTAIYSHS